MNDEHTCIENKRTDPNLRTKAVADGIAHLFKHKFNQCDSVYTPQQLIKDIKTNYGVVINYRQAYSGSKRGIELIRGSPDESYQYLVNYSYMLSQLNEGTVTEIKTDENDHFLYYFFAFGVSLRGFKGCCRPAFSVDANEQIYPLAFGIVDSENNDSWEWFLRKLCDALGPKDYAMNEDLVIASDRKESIPRGILLAFPDANHVFCIHHISENIKKRYHNNGAAVAFIRAAKAFNNDDYEKAMRDLGLASKAAL